jgi:ketosteroid isomerase-like protein
MSRNVWVALLLAVSLTHIANGEEKPRGRAADEGKIWKLEQSYWEYVKALDVPGYKSLWHEDFMGWPSTAPAPMGKDHIANWLEDDRAAKNTLQCYKLEHAGFTLVGDVAVVHYYLTEHWLDKSGKTEKGQPRTIKVTHTWLRSRDSWRIIGGMAGVIPNRPDCN